jgi:hypothetical protein
MQKLLLESPPRKAIQHVYTIVIFANLESGGKLGRKIKNAQVSCSPYVG